jgi:hypothetical protein
LKRIDHERVEERAMKVVCQAEVIETKRKLPIWTVKANGRYKASFAGRNGKARAVAFATRDFVEFVIVDIETARLKQMTSP